MITDTASEIYACIHGPPTITDFDKLQFLDSANPHREGVQILPTKIEKSLHCHLLAVVFFD